MWMYIIIKNSMPDSLKIVNKRGNIVFKYSKLQDLLSVVSELVLFKQKIWCISNESGKSMLANKENKKFVIGLEK